MDKSARVNPGTLQNRVDPFGRIHAAPERGTMFGNRGGCFHTKEQVLKSGHPWSSERWICCVLDFKGRKRKLMQPGLYTELFFLDEATAFAAGHRPCMECRRPDAIRFADAWARANLPHGERLRTISEIDRQAHAERVLPGTRDQRTWRAKLAGLPAGAFVTLDARPDQPQLIYNDALHRWGFGGYSDGVAFDGEEVVNVLTPRSFVAAFVRGHAPAVHQSAL